MITKISLTEEILIMLEWLLGVFAHFLFEEDSTFSYRLV